MKQMKDCDSKQQEEGQISQELSGAENAAARLTARIDIIETQLISVLQETIQPSPEEAKPERSLVPLAARIHAHFKLLDYLGNRLEEIEARLELR